MPGRTPYEAIESFLEPLREALAVLDGYSKIMVSPRGGFTKNEPYSWVLNDALGMELRGVGWLRATMQFEVIDCDPTSNDSGHPLRVTTLGYQYKIVDIDGQDVIRFHWHPRGHGANNHPHIHARPNLELHFYLPRVTLEQVIRVCMQLGAPLTTDRDEAIRHLAEIEAPHMLNRTWIDWPPGREEPYRTSGV